jgi:hypothetical protein
VREPKDPVIHVAAKMRRSGSHKPAKLWNMARLRSMKLATTTRSRRPTRTVNAIAVRSGAQAPGARK